MKTICTILLTILANLAIAQFAVIDDKDGYSNVRSAAKPGSNIQDKLENGHLVYCMDTQGNWVIADYDIKNQSKDGCIYKDRLKLISSFEKIGLISKGANNSVFKKDSIKVTVTTQPFDKSKYRFTYDKESKTVIKKINGRDYYGTDGLLPMVEFKSIIVLWGNNTVVLPGSATDNLFEARVKDAAVNFDRVNNVLYVQTEGGDAAGSYYVIWKIVNGVYKERYIARGF
jgi:hypothetical protein